jgi:nucleoside-diphosphate-sugar epimerase
MKLLVTGASGKIGQVFLTAFLAQPKFSDWQVVALCNNRMVEARDRLSVLKGSIADAQAVARALEGVTHVLHLAAVKESPDQAIDVALKGLYVLLEAFRRKADARQFILLSGDCVVGHIFQKYAYPITEQSPRRAYKGSYALTKVLEEVMLEQFGCQYGLNWTTLRAPWVMEKDDFRFAFDLTDAQFGGPPWEEVVGAERLARMRSQRVFPLMRDAEGQPLKRSFIHVDDLVRAIIASIDNEKAFGELFNIAMSEPVDYRQAADIAAHVAGLAPCEIDTPFHSNWLDNSKARKVLGWEPEIDLAGLFDRAWRYRRAEDDPRIIWYPG